MSPLLEPFKKLLFSDDPDLLIYTMRLPELKATIESIKQVAPTHFPEMNLGYLTTGTAREMHRGLARFINELSLSTMENQLGERETHEASMKIYDKKEDRGKFEAGIKNEKWQDAVGREDVKLTIPKRKIHFLATYEILKLFHMANNKENHDWLKEKFLVPTYIKSLENPFYKITDGKKGFYVRTNIVWGILPSGGKATFKVNSDIVPLMANKLRVVPQLSAEERQGLFSYREWLDDNKLGHNTKREYFDDIIGLIARDEECGNNAKIGKYVSSAATVFIKKDFSKKLTEKLSIPPLITEEQKKDFIVLSEFLRLLPPSVLPTKNNKVLKRYFEQLIESKPEVVLHQEGSTTLTVKDAIKKLRTEAGAETIFIHKDVVKYFRDNGLPVLSGKPGQNFIAEKEFIQSILGDGAEFRQFGKQVRKFLLELKKYHKDEYISSGKDGSLSFNQAITYDSSNTKEVRNLYVHKALKKYTEDNFIAKKEKGDGFIIGAKLLIKLKVKVDDTNIRASQNILNDLWKRRNEFFDHQGESRRIGDHVKKLASGMNSGVYIDEAVLGTLMTKDMIKAEREKLKRSNIMAL